MVECSSLPTKSASKRKHGQPRRLPPAPSAHGRAARPHRAVLLLARRAARRQAAAALRGDRHGDGRRVAADHDARAPRVRRQGWARGAPLGRGLP
eukprot:1179329-Prymnesium_polylepis.1